MQQECIFINIFMQLHQCGIQSTDDTWATNDALQLDDKHKTNVRNINKTTIQSTLQSAKRGGWKRQVFLRNAELQTLCLD